MSAPSGFARFSTANTSLIPKFTPKSSQPTFFDSDRKWPEVSDSIKFRTPNKTAEPSTSSINTSELSHPNMNVGPVALSRKRKRSLSRSSDSGSTPNGQDGRVTVPSSLENHGFQPKPGILPPDFISSPAFRERSAHTSSVSSSSSANSNRDFLRQALLARQKNNFSQLATVLNNQDFDPNIYFKYPGVPELKATLLYLVIDKLDIGAFRLLMQNQRIDINKPPIYHEPGADPDFMFTPLGKVRDALDEPGLSASKRTKLKEMERLLVERNAAEEPLVTYKVASSLGIIPKLHKKVKRE